MHRSIWVISLGWGGRSCSSIDLIMVIRPRGLSRSSPRRTYVGQVAVQKPQWTQRRRIASDEAISGSLRCSGEKEVRIAAAIIVDGDAECLGVSYRCEQLGAPHRHCDCLTIVAILMTG